MLFYFSDSPVINVAKSNFMKEEGTLLTIPLSIMANPKPNITLLRNDRVSNVFANMTVVYFWSLSRNQSGEYSLKISNNISTTFYNFTIEVTCEL